MEEEQKKVYIGNLSYSVNDGDVRKALEDKGVNVKEVRIITDKYSGRSKGFGFAEFETEEDAQKAIDALNGQELGGRTLRVNKAQKMKPRRDKFGGGGGFKGRGGSGGGRY
jgi:RNA recognition motif-containing protein